VNAIPGSTIGMEGAIAVIDAAVVEATGLGVAVAISVVDPGGNLVAFSRMDGSPLLSRQVASDKAWTAIAFGQPTTWWADMLAQDPSLDALGNNNRLMPVPGGVPLAVDGVLAGGVGVSGATATQDHQIAVAGAAALELPSLTSVQMEDAIRRYFDACNSGDAAAVAAFFVPDAVHYFPPGMYEGPFVGAGTIGRRWAAAVRDLGSVWTVDQVICDPATARAVIEWTHFKTAKGTVLRGDEWYLFDRATGLIREIRAYYASPQEARLDRLELGGFDYGGRGYPLDPPFTR
jgi:uncharacterized protein GlcG (DUF336 family)